MKQGVRFMPRDNTKTRQAVLEVVANQLRDGNPPETKETYERLQAKGVSDEDARILIAQVVACEIFDVVKQQEEYNHDRFVRRLQRLPSEPFDD
jgi:hypothetical protein